MLRPSLLPQRAGDPIQWMYPISWPKWLVRVWEYDPILANKRRVRTFVQVWTFVQGIAEGRCRGILFLWTWHWEDVGWEILPSCRKWFRELVQEWSKQRNECRTRNMEILRPVDIIWVPTSQPWQNYTTSGFFQLINYFCPCQFALSFQTPEDHWLPQVYFPYNW